METRHLPGTVMFSLAATVTVLGLSAWGAVSGSLESGSAQTAVCEDAPSGNDPDTTADETDCEGKSDKRRFHIISKWGFRKSLPYRLF